MNNVFFIELLRFIHLTKAAFFLFEIIHNLIRDIFVTRFIFETFSLNVHISIIIKIQVAENDFPLQNLHNRHRINLVPAVSVERS